MSDNVEKENRIKILINGSEVNPRSTDGSESLWAVPTSQKLKEVQFNVADYIEW